MLRSIPYGSNYYKKKSLQLNEVTYKEPSGYFNEAMRAAAREYDRKHGITKTPYETEEKAKEYCEKYASQGEWEADEIKQYLSEGYAYR